VSTTAHVLGCHRDVAAVLADPSFVVPAAEPADTGIRWLRAAVSRFTNGADHARRRAQAEALLTALDAGRLRAEAAAMTNTVLDSAADGTVDVMGALARHVPIAVLADALAIRAEAPTLVDAVTTAAAAYPPGATPEMEACADGAVNELVELLGGPTDATIARLTLLVQACDATAGLIGNSVSIALHLPERSDVDGILTETLRYCPPVRGTRRVATAEKTIANTTIESGDTVQLDFDAANRDPDVFETPDRFDPTRSDARHLTFGHGFRSCPGTDPALGLAAGVVAVVLERCAPRFTRNDVEYERSPLRVPASLAVTVAGRRAGHPGNAPTP
jgi:cytochrome P450